MMKLILASTSAIALLGLAACSDTDTSTTQGIPEEPATTEQAPAEEGTAATPPATEPTQPAAPTE